MVEIKKQHRMLVRPCGLLLP